MNPNKRNLARALGKDVADLTETEVALLEITIERRRLFSRGSGNLTDDVILILSDKLQPLEYDVENWVIPKRKIVSESALSHGKEIVVKIKSQQFQGTYVKPAEKGWHRVTLLEDPDGKDARSVRLKDIRVGRIGKSANADTVLAAEKDAEAALAKEQQKIGERELEMTVNG